MMSTGKQRADDAKSIDITLPPNQSEHNLMPPPDGDVSQTPEPKSTGGLASVFKSLTGGRSIKSSPAQNALKASIPAATVQFAEQIHSSTTSQQSIPLGGVPSDYEVLLGQLDIGQSVPDRISAANALRLSLTDHPLNKVTRIWYAGKELIQPSNTAEARQAGFELLTTCVQQRASDLERKEYFNTLTAPLDPADFGLQLSAVVELSRNGRDLSGFHYDVFPVLTKWLRFAFEAYEEARKPRRSASGRPASKRTAKPEEVNLHQLFAFIINVIKFSFNVTSDEETGLLLEAILSVAMQARSISDLKACINVMDAIVTYGAIPDYKLRDCIRVLCSIYALVPDLQDVAWSTISNLSRSHNGHNMVDILLDIIRYPNKESTREIRGSLNLLQRLFLMDAREGFPTVSFSLLMEAINMSLSTSTLKIETEIFDLILALLATEEGCTNDVILEEDWTVMLDVVAKVSKRIHETSDGTPIEFPMQSLDGKSAERRALTQSPHHRGPNVSSANTVDSTATSLSHKLYRIITTIEEILIAHDPSQFLHKEACVAFFAQVNDHLPEACATLVIEFYDESRFCYPSEPNWKKNIQVLLDAFFTNRGRPSAIRLQALKAITDVYEVVDMMSKDQESDLVYNFVSAILKDLAEESDPIILQEVVDFAVAVADNAEPDVFHYIMRQLHHTVSHDRMQSPLMSPGSRLQPATGTEFRPPPSSPSNIITRGMIQIYMRAMDNNAEKAVQSYEEILRIAKSNSSEVDARISAMKMLFRIRADWENRVFMTPFTESDGLAASLYRTAPSLARKQAEDLESTQQQTRPIRNDETPSTLGRGIRIPSSGQLNTLAFKATTRASSGVSRTLQLHHHMWMTPDADALPAHVSGRASVLYASWETDEGSEPRTLPQDRQILRIPGWLDIVISLLQNGCDWEIYSYILVHLAAQLANPGVFKAALPQIRDLRKILCSQISNNSFHEPPLSSGLRKADVAICIYQILTMLISYHGSFHRAEEDEIVKAFVQGLTGWERTAKSCIHALSICCHELPSSMRSSLFSALQKMSQIITQSQIAVHVLEYLACLSRLPDLYSNLREEEFKFIFGICFRYLQYVREKSPDLNVNRQSGQPYRHSSNLVDQPNSISESNAGESNFVPNTSDDLPQYVYALAYHVIIFWFLALRLGDRSNQVSWIIKNLVAMDESGKQHLDEQTQVVIDFMQRTAYANVDESIANPDFVPKKYGSILKRRWIVGQSLITIEQASETDWAQITKRQPSATSHYMIHERFERPPAHQMLQAAGGTQHAEMNMILPNYLLLQLGSTFAMSEASRPIPLPDDDMVKRAISSFDRISTVDGHKVGVIYIGEGQTQELEILANVMGSSDYTEFLEGLGTLTKLEGATFNTQGLDRQYNSDGEYTFCWRDRVTEIVFHVTTLMPTNLEHDAQCIGKKRHIGNDFVNIVFNNSGLPFKFDTFPSDFNFVNIVITPESRATFVATRIRTKDYARKSFYRVQVMSKPGFPEISPAAETKLVSLHALPEFIRLLALNASVFSLVWASRQGGDHVSSWRTRLREIARLKEKYKPKAATSASTALSPSGAASPQNNTEIRPRDSFSRRASVATFHTTLSDQKDEKARRDEDGHNGIVVVKENMIETLDFSRWA